MRPSFWNVEQYGRLLCSYLNRQYMWSSASSADRVSLGVDHMDWCQEKWQRDVRREDVVNFVALNTPEKIGRESGSAYHIMELRRLKASFAHFSLKRRNRDGQIPTDANKPYQTLPLGL